MNCAGPESVGNIDGELHHIILADTGSNGWTLLVRLIPKKGKPLGTVKDSNGNSIDVYESSDIKGRGRYILDESSGPWIAVSQECQSGRETAR